MSAVKGLESDKSKKRSKAKDKIASQLNSSLEEVANGLRVEDWIRSYVIRSTISMRLLPIIGEEYMDAVEALDERAERKYRAALVVARDRASAFVDATGIIGIPVIIGLAAMQGFLEDDMLILLLLALIAYMMIYIYFRMMLTAITSLLHLANLVTKGTPDEAV